MAMTRVNAALVNNGIVAKTTTYTAKLNDNLILASGSAFTITLPAAASSAGKILEIMKTDSSMSNIITVDGNASETINGATTTTLNTQYEAIRIVCDGTGWIILERRIPSEWAAYTPTITGFGTPTDVQFTHKRVGDSLWYKFYFTSGTPTATQARLSLPSPLTCKIGAVTRELVGVGSFNNNNQAFPSFLASNGNAYLTAGILSATNSGFTEANGNTIIGSAGIGMGGTAIVPITGWAG